MPRRERGTATHRRLRRHQRVIREASGYRGRVADQEGVRPGGANHVDRAPDEPTARSRDRVAVGAAWVAAALGIASAATSAYWAFGGTALLDTVGGEIERWGRERGPVVVIALAAIVLLKLAVAVAAPILVGIGHPPAWMAGRVPRILGWIAATVLIGVRRRAHGRRAARADRRADRGAGRRPHRHRVARLAVGSLVPRVGHRRVRDRAPAEGRPARTA